MNEVIVTSCGTNGGVRAAGGVEAEVIGMASVASSVHTLFDVVEGGDLGEVVHRARHGEGLDSW
jgi:hypothetical protein